MPRHMAHREKRHTGNVWASRIPIPTLLGIKAAKSNSNPRWKNGGLIYYYKYPVITCFRGTSSSNTRCNLVQWIVQFFIFKHLVSMANPMEQIALPRKEIKEEQRAKALQRARKQRQAKRDGIYIEHIDLDVVGFTRAIVPSLLLANAKFNITSSII
ncbi:hypothetical protein HAX54_031656 [Datura stramonium]|uniref:Uncharacterized protein n=1 Tax=Datura stramonium TaxID=4076 RepID=A0ABS8VC97_DATST|nr:hypothetical protein [Datura stramonium]